MKKVFISHSSNDKPFVRKLKRDLNLNYIYTWVDEDEMFPGNSLIEKLSFGLKESTHFLIILSPFSIQSEWVKLELENALAQVEQSTIEKIIPVLYRDCIIPKPLNKLLYGNFSKDIMYYEKGWIEFVGDNYREEFAKIVKSINKTTPPLTLYEKEDLSNIKPNIGANTEGSPSLYLMVIGYTSISKFINLYISEENKSRFTKEEMLRFSPIVLPNFLKDYLKDLRFGSEITLKIKGGIKVKGEFAMFSSNNNRIAIPSVLRKELSLKNKSTYKVSIINITTIEFEEINDK